MTVFDYIVIAIVLGSIIVAVMRGLVAEVLSLGSWLIAFWCAKQFAPAVSDWLPASLSSEGVRVVASFILVFFLVWLATALARVTLTGVLDSTGLGGINRMLGAAFGLARGLVLATVLVLLGGLTHMPEKDVWRNALLAHPLETAALSLRPWLPPLLAEHISYPG
ncbi:CvpA family protein [Paludibacterium yongneupense]|uniref:CvpA family protein n=1 Tax=Paludibacterium yongneupense TaxID=400061 RepID=UPI000409B491|nr:CvpA family protein [Paludibacterium yongneupense]